MPYRLLLDMTPAEAYSLSSKPSDFQDRQMSITSLLHSPRDEVSTPHEKVNSRRRQDSISKHKSSSFGTTFKLLKACSFCRRRKIKCVVNSNNICENCKLHNKECLFDHKVVYNNLEQKRKVRVSKESPINLAATEGESSFPISFVGSTPNSIDISPSSVSSSNYSLDNLELLYQSNVEEFTPFLDVNVFKSNFDRFCENCIQIAMWQNNPTELENNLNFINTSINSKEFEWNQTNLACFFLVPIRAPIGSSTIRKSLVAFNHMFEQRYESLSINLLLGAMINDGFYSMFSGSKLTTSPQILSKISYYLGQLDPNSFSHHFSFVGYFIYNMIWLGNDNTKLSFVERKRRFLQLEFDILLWPAKLPSQLSIVKDKLGGNYSAFILHILHNTLLCCFYTYSLKNKDTIAEMISISPVPGLYHFISGLAQSNFRVAKEINGAWTLLSNCVVKTAKCLTDLNEIMDFDPFRSSLSLLYKLPNVYDTIWQDEVYSTVENLLMDQEFTVDDDVDGAIVFWVFRDIRSLALQTQINEKKVKK